MDLKRRFILFSFVILCWTSAASAQDDDSNGGLLGGILHGIVDFVDDLFGGEDDDEVQDAPEGGFCAALVDDNSNSNPCRFESEYAMEAFNKKNYCRGQY